MLTRETIGSVAWIDLVDPSVEEVEELMREYKIHPLVAGELLGPTERPRIDHYDNHLYLILHFPMRDGSVRTNCHREVDFLIGKDFLITAGYGKEALPASVRESLLTPTAKAEDSDYKHAGLLFFAIIRMLYGELVDELETISTSTEDLENRLFDPRERNMVLHISLVSRDLIALKQSIRMHRDVLESFKDAAGDFFGKPFEPYARATIGEYYRAYNLLRSNMDTVDELRETNNSLVTTKQNEVMKVIAILAFVTFPLSLIAGIFGMNTQILPIVGHQFDFWIVMGIMATATVCFFVFFKYKHWL